MLKRKIRNLLADQRFSRFGDSGTKGITSRFTKENQQWSRNEYWKRRLAGHGKFDSQIVNISFFLGQPQSSRLSGNARKKDLDVTLDDLSVQCMQIGPAG